ncbi:uncharacterized protein C56G2.4-like [Babylonia areolata]|uniref:uncharacterized protein C56G2.4-like n=1 Tax=Babylonia areolata TaxID=304850 RepID=UPI003FCFB79D
MKSRALCVLLAVCFAVVPVGGIGLYNNGGMEPSSPCGQSARSEDLPTCLQAIRKRAEDPSLFWFGNSYSARCGGRDPFLADCYNPRHSSASDSVATRIFSRRELDPQVLDTFLEVTYTTQPGSYKACEHQFTYNQSKEVTLDPLSMTVMTPYEVRAQPRMWWPAEEDTLHTLLLVDVGYFTVKALQLNIPGNNMTAGQTVVQYEGPLNPTRNNNPYVFVLLRQSGPVTLSDRWQQVFTQRDVHTELGDFMEEHSLKGPVALSWVLVYGDAYAAEVARVRGQMNTCAHFVAEAFQGEDVQFIPNRTYYGHALQQIQVYVNVTFEASHLAVNSCCSVYTFPARTMNLNPLGDATVMPAHARNEATVYVTLHMATALPNTQRDFKDKTLTLMMVDPHVPSEAFGNLRLPFAHWLVVNIRGGDVASGNVVQSYMGPAPPDPHPHRYYFLLFLQPRDLDPARMDYSACNCSWAFRGRCRFDVMTMVREQGLELVGVTWMEARHDAFVRQLYVQAGLTPRCSACHGLPGYADPCPTRPASSARALCATGMCVLSVCLGALLRLVLSGAGAFRG